jgi:hypothetical protein
LQTDDGGHQTRDDEEKERGNDVHQSETLVINGRDPFVQVARERKSRFLYFRVIY